MADLGKKALGNVAIPLVRYNLPGLVTNLNSSAINKFDRKIRGREGVRAKKGFALSFSNKDMNDVKQGGGFLEALLAPLATSLVQLQL